jgi:hypothetical protein
MASPLTRALRVLAATLELVSKGGQSVGSWSLEALGQTFFKWGTDTSNAHVQPNGMYHYHGIPEGLGHQAGQRQQGA